MHTECIDCMRDLRLLQVFPDADETNPAEGFDSRHIGIHTVLINMPLPTRGSITCFDFLRLSAFDFTGRSS